MSEELQGPGRVPAHPAGPVGHLATIVVGAAGGALLGRRLQLGLESDLDGVMHQRASAVADSLAHGHQDLATAQGPVQLVNAAGVVTASSGGASPTQTLMNDERQQRAANGALIVDTIQPLGGQSETVRVLVNRRPAAA